MERNSRSHHRNGDAVAGACGTGDPRGTPNQWVVLRNALVIRFILHCLLLLRTPSRIVVSGAPQEWAHGFTDVVGNDNYCCGRHSRLGQ
jgi:hypothetical protein